MKRATRDGLGLRAVASRCNNGVGGAKDHITPGGLWIALRRAPDMGAPIAPVVIDNDGLVEAHLIEPTTADFVTVRAEMRVHSMRCSVARAKSRWLFDFARCIAAATSSLDTRTLTVQSWAELERVALKKRRA